MKLPRGVSADRVIHALEHLGYVVIRQKGSHVRLRHEGPPVHMIAVLLHNPLPVDLNLARPARPVGYSPGG